MTLKLPGSTADGSRQACLIGAGLLSMGILHLAAPKGFDSSIPEELPLPARFVTYASGVAELAIGVGLLLPRTRRAAGLAAAVLFIAVFPANINTVRVVGDRPVGYRIAALARLPLQIPLITSAWQVYKRSM
jgi:uncharacterized membrane protein